jgi:hypothetical protein
MRGMMMVIALLGYAAVSLGSFSRPARADTMSFAAGIESNGGVGTCYGWSQTAPRGLVRDPGNNCNKHYFFPLYWTNFFSAGTTRQITVRGRRVDSGSLLDCTAMTFDSQGVLLSQDSESFPVTSGVTTITLGVTNVLASGSSFVVCNQMGNTSLQHAGWTP